MILRLTRDVLTDSWTLGILTIDYLDDNRGALSFGFTCEDRDRGLTSEDPLDLIHERKVPGQTAIPTGRYRVRTTWSPRFRRLMPLVCDVPGFSGIRIHSGNDAGDSAGCVLVGLARDVAAGTVSRSRNATKWLDAEIARVEAAGAEVWLDISRGA